MSVDAHHDRDGGDGILVIADPETPGAWLASTYFVTIGGDA